MRPSPARSGILVHTSGSPLYEYAELFHVHRQSAYLIGRDRIVRNVHSPNRHRWPDLARLLAPTM